LSQVALDKVVSVVFKGFGVKLSVKIRLKRSNIGSHKAGVFRCYGRPFPSILKVVIL
jgi:hypothetical protein